MKRAPQPTAKKKSLDTFVASLPKAEQAVALTPDSLSPRRCHYIDGHDYIARMRAGIDPFCGAPVKPGSQWCAKHHALCYRKPTPFNPFALPVLDT